MSDRILLVRERIIESIRLLASPGEVQLNCFPDFVCKPDEIANSLGDWLAVFKKEEIQLAFTEKEIQKIEDIDNAFFALSKEDFCETAVLHSEKWEGIRKKAKNLLIVLGEEDIPPNINFV